MKAFLKMALGWVTGGSSVWLPYVIVAGLVAVGTGVGMWKLVVAPRLEAAELKVAAADAAIQHIAEANAETERSLRVMQRQAEFDRQVTAKVIAEQARRIEQVGQIKKDIAHVSGAQDSIDPVELYGNQRLRELRAARRGQNGDSPSLPARSPAALRSGP